MPIRDCPIHSFPNNETTVLLPIKIINPYTNINYKTWGLIDTGATECAIPASIASILGHILLKGELKSISTGNGLANAYRHTSTIEIFHPLNLSNQAIYKIENVKIDFMPNLSIPLLGVRGFMANFKLEINYPNRIFSLIQ